jgi:hypothetical protein
MSFRLDGRDRIPRWLFPPRQEVALKRVLVSVVAVAALAIPAQAVASSKKYVGGVNPSGDFSFTVKKKNGKKKVKNPTFIEVPTHCDQGNVTTSGKLAFSVKLKHKEFTAVGQLPGGSVTVVGHVNGNNASGTIQVLGASPIDGDGTGSGCDTGELSWSASR